MYMTKFVLTFFTSVLPISFCSRIFDIFLFENQKIIYKASLAVMKILEKTLLERTSIDHISAVISNPYKFMNRMTQDQFIETCLTFTFSSTFLGKIEYEYDSKNK